MLLAQDICNSKSIANIVVKIVVVVGTTYCASVVCPVFSQTEVASYFTRKIKTNHRIRTLFFCNLNRQFEFTRPESYSIICFNFFEFTVEVNDATCDTFTTLRSASPRETFSP